MKNKLFIKIERLQDLALSLGDLKTCIKLNWLKYSIDALTYDDACYKLQEIILK